MLIKKENIRTKNVILNYSVLFAIICFISFSLFIVFNKSLVYEGDGVLQYYANLIKLRRMIGNLFRGIGFSFGQ